MWCVELLHHLEEEGKIGVTILLHAELLHRVHQAVYLLHQSVCRWPQHRVASGDDNDLAVAQVMTPLPRVTVGEGEVRTQAMAPFPQEL